MRPRTFTPFQKAIDVIEELPLEDQETLIDLIHHRLVERRRAEIARHAVETLQSVREGQAQFGNFADLRRDLLDRLLDELAGCLGEETAQNYNFKLKIGSFYEAR
jgi:hypothetical protein